MRGVDYAAQGHVTDVEVNASRVTAAVLGTRPYDVSVELGASELVCACSCPMGDADEFCKHLVALGITLLGDIADEPEVDEASDTVDLAAWLADQPASRLRELLLAEAQRDPQVHKRLAVLAAAETGEDLDLAAMHTAITEAFSWGHYDRDGFVEYRDAWAWRNDVESVIDDVENALDAGFAEEVVALVELVLAKLNSAVDSVDDSDGHLRDLSDRACDLHLRACERAAPDPVELAGRLFDYALRGDGLGLFLDAVVDYAPVLGDAGLAAYRELAEQEWARIPAIGPGEDRSSDDERFTITTIMEHVAEVTGGLDELLEVMQRDVASAYAFLRIAQKCRRHARDDLALDWACRGLEAFPGDVRLRELVGDIHADAGRHDNATEAERELFADGPSLGRYKRLKQRAEAAGSWSEERAAALAIGGSVLVEILLWEGDGDAAWDAAQRYGCSDSLWTHVAAARAEQHPADALDVYRRQLDRAVQPADQRAYNEVVRLLKTMRPLYATIGQTNSFDHLVASIRTTYKRRRTLLERLNRAGLHGVSR
jgi:uncharacterized Zn finger protein